MIVQLIGYALIMLISTILLVRRVAIDSSRSPTDLLEQPYYVRERLLLWSGIASAVLWSGIALVLFGATLAIIASALGLYFGRLFFRKFIRDLSRESRKDSDSEKLP